jgi:hypothetical protein
VPERGPEVFDLLNSEALNIGAEVRLGSLTDDNIGTHYQISGSGEQIKRLTGLYKYLVQQLDIGTFPKNLKSE